MTTTAATGAAGAAVAAATVVDGEVWAPEMPGTPTATPTAPPTASPSTGPSAALGIFTDVPFALLAAASWLTRRSLAPVDHMVTAAEQIAGGARGMRLKPERTDTELGRLATSFDGMVDSLEQSESRMRQFVADASHELHTPTAAIQAAAEGFVEDDQPGRSAIIDSSIWWPAPTGSADW